jgi:hypothetical protein
MDDASGPSTKESTEMKRSLDERRGAAGRDHPNGEPTSGVRARGASDEEAHDAAPPAGVRLRVALDVLGALARHDAPLSRRTAESGLHLADLSVDARGVALFTAAGDASGAAEVVCEILAWREGPAALDALNDVPDAVRKLVWTALVEEVPKTAKELAAALAEASSGVTGSHADVRAFLEANPAVGLDVRVDETGAELLDDEMKLPPVSTMLASFKKTRAGLFGFAKPSGAAAAAAPHDDDGFDAKQTTLFRRRLPPRSAAPSLPGAKVILGQSADGQRWKATQRMTRREHDVAARPRPAAGLAWVLDRLRGAGPDTAARSRLLLVGLVAVVILLALGVTIALVRGG